ncbi:uncharacterized protein LOC143036793 isoform X2 [Oratosquilla oratoria]|uniref:uncharacterized protein LOC143036793 isoform X2 n=1 Tax=Oratosquilla oratoria TaxID=337810 RepID=UPI003F7636D3
MLCRSFLVVRGKGRCGMCPSQHTDKCRFSSVIDKDGCCYICGKGFFHRCNNDRECAFDMRCQIMDSNFVFFFRRAKFCFPDISHEDISIRLPLF